MITSKRYPLSEKHPLGRSVSAESVFGFLRNREDLKEQYEGLSDGQKDEFLKFCTGAKGLRICYDPVFKFVMDPEKHPERLSEFLSVVLRQRVSVKRALPREGERLCEDGSLVIMDIVVELEDGSLANVEIQKIGYAFPGPRAACYSSDLVLRQYTRIRDKRKKEFSYQDLKTVYTIVIMEESARAMRQAGEGGSYVHYARQQFDTGIQMNLLQEYVFLCLDSYKDMLHNKDIRTLQEAWVGFLAFDEPERIWQIQSRFPQFMPMYEELADFRNDIEEVLSMFSKELAMMDRNLIKYMMEENMEEFKVKLNAEVRAEYNAEIQRLKEENEETRKRWEEAQKEREESQKKIREQEAIIEQLRKQNSKKI